MSDWMRELRELEALRNDGLISAEEYEFQREKIVPKIDSPDGSVQEEIEVTDLDEVPVVTVEKSELLFSKAVQAGLGIAMLAVFILGILVLQLRSDGTFLNQTVNTTRTTIWGFLVILPAIFAYVLLQPLPNKLTKSRQLMMMGFAAPISILSFFVFWESITFKGESLPRLTNTKEVGLFKTDDWDKWVAPRILYTLSATLIIALALFALFKLRSEITKPKLRRESFALVGTTIFTVGYLFPPITETATYYSNDAIFKYDYTFSNLRALGNDPSFFKHITDDYGLGIVFPILLLLASLIAISFRRAEVRKAAVGGLIIGLFIFVLNDIIAVASSNLVQYEYNNYYYQTTASMESNLGFSVGFILTAIGSVITLFSLPLEVKQKLIPSNIGRTVPPGRN